mmetsp:Transcript_10777/g.26693  ORF Transcript_10777/g.26693 Transcript_10777/m.26693 type:complete len:233 (+) Transcript_10777:118-816(+)
MAYARLLPRRTRGLPARHRPPAGPLPAVLSSACPPHTGAAILELLPRGQTPHLCHTLSQGVTHRPPPSPPLAHRQEPWPACPWTDGGQTISMWKASSERPKQSSASSKSLSQRSLAPSREEDPRWARPPCDPGARAFLCALARRGLMRPASGDASGAEVGEAEEHTSMASAAVWTMVGWACTGGEVFSSTGQTRCGARDFLYPHCPMPAGFQRQAAREVASALGLERGLVAR